MQTIICFDSGIGGLAYLRELRGERLLRGERWIYLADNFYFPFGEKAPNELRERICAVICRALACYPAQLVLLLCNTATVLALDELRRRLPQQLFIGTVPAIKPAAAASRRRKIAMLASRSTSRADCVAQLHHKFAADCDLQAINAAGLIEFIEREWRPNLSAAAAVAPFVAPVLASGADQIVLGCTHFLHVRDELCSQLQAADPKLQLCDSVAGVGQRLKNLLAGSQNTAAAPDLLLLTRGSRRWQYWADVFGMDMQLLSGTY